MGEVYRIAGGRKLRRGKKLPTDMTKFVVGEVSLVDSGSMEDQPEVLAKVDLESGGKPKPAQMSKRAALTDAGPDGFAHLVHLDFGSGDHTSGKTSWDGNHDHPWVMNTEGEIVIGEAIGADGTRHGHGVANVSKVADGGADTPTAPDNTVSKNTAAEATGEAGMADKPNAADKGTAADTGALQKKLDEQAAANERLTKVVALNTAERGHFDSLEKADQDAFLKMDEQGRGAELAKAADLNPVVHTSPDGTEYRKNDDKRLVEMAKTVDAQATAMKKIADDNKRLEFEKRASDELKHMKGTPVVKGAVLRAVEGIADEEVRKGALEMLKAQDLGVSDLLKTRGTTTPAVGGDDGAGSDFEALVQKHMEKEGVDEPAATDAVMKTAEGAAAFHKSLNGAV